MRQKLSPRRAWTYLTASFLEGDESATTFCFQPFEGEEGGVLHNREQK